MEAISVIVPTAMAKHRSQTIKRAISSVLNEGDVVGEVLVIANGPSSDAESLACVAGLSDKVKVLQLRTGSYPLARRVGFELASNDLICALDDDDEYLPGSLHLRSKYMRTNQHISVLVSDGFVGESNSKRLGAALVAHAARDPVGAMFVGNWLASCGGTFRRSKVPLAAFDPEFKYFEWTLTAFILARGSAVAFASEPHFRCHDTPRSLSKSQESVLAEPELWRRVNRVLDGTGYLKKVSQRYGAACHAASEEALKRREASEAWGWHGRSLMSAGGFRYITYTRHLMRGGG